MKHINFIFSFFILIGYLNVQAQTRVSSEFVSSELIVMVKKNASIDVVCGNLSKQFSTQISPKKRLSERLNLWLVTFDPEGGSISEALELANRMEEIKIVQLNHTNVETRSEPNDSLFFKQWSFLNDGTNGGMGFADINATAAWDITTGGLTPNGDTIVVAVIDQGFELTHVDLIDNWFHNHQEIPGNNLDDDGNGYVDDIMGWNAYTSSGTHFSDLHGTHVSGIVGARGNNQIGITGVNWNVKIMPISGSSSLESTVVEAYAYVLEMRKLYNESNGTKGAFVVSANSSFGVDYGQPQDFPIWCAMFDSLGSVGVLSVGATANANVNVDMDGDIPTACSSDFLVTVTNTNSNDVIQNGSGFGVESIDLGAPGEKIYSTVTNNFYGAKNGTSMAAPHVAGAIALMYSAICPDVEASFEGDEAGLALYIKTKLLDDGVEQLAALNGKVKSGGRLDLFGAVKSVSELCLQIKLTGVNSDCDSCNGTISAEVIGESGLVQYSWSTGETTANLIGLCPGVYTLTATDATGSFTISTFLISDLGGPKIIVQKTNPSCAGDGDGFVTATGGFNYQWIDGGFGANRSSMGAGNYYLKATDSSGSCTTVVLVNLIAPDSLKTEYIKTLPSTQSGSDGKLEAKPIGGNSPYSFLWQDGSTAASISNISRGKYAITITDSKGCDFEDTAFLGWMLSIPSENKMNENNWRLFPNPANNVITIESGSAIHSVVIVDATGKLVFFVNAIDSYHYTISNLNLESGFYFVEIECSNSKHRDKLLISNAR